MVFDKARQQLVMLLTACLTTVSLHLEQPLQAASTRAGRAPPQCIIPEFQYVGIFRNVDNQPCETVCTEKAAESVAWWKVLGSDFCQREHWVGNDYYPPRASIGNVMSDSIVSIGDANLYAKLRVGEHTVHRATETAARYCSCNVTVILSNIWKPEGWPWPALPKTEGLCSLQALAIRSAPRGSWQLASSRYLSQSGVDCEMDDFENILSRPLITFDLPFTQNSALFGVSMSKSEMMNDAKRWLEYAAVIWI
ncbi:hypothetical protein BCR37DRAFT_389134 [Protomyces lactucae-debilis]|uniref:Uncharacterized protein n=1 Tax=Protomyces lactucae-debilis TaxID=2754530 RepID=A0A1Y2F0D3_PROLT|nr:uncharacterized protein BCR37DRAFT_389134 [Protomyces lactucae-debilis]ORY77309.1 hypothetical protein BCR37DRAFT_389134 [Protomyces lactucae-debilis]